MIQVAFAIALVTVIFGASPAAAQSPAGQVITQMASPATVDHKMVLGEYGGKWEIAGFKDKVYLTLTDINGEDLRGSMYTTGPNRRCHGRDMAIQNAKLAAVADGSYSITFEIPGCATYDFKLKSKKVVGTGAGDRGVATFDLDKTK